MSNLSKENNTTPRSKTLKWGLSICTTIYILLLPFLFQMAMLSLMIADGPGTTVFMVLVVMSLMFLIPLSIPVSIYLMWSRYARKQQNRALIFAGLPLYTFGAVFLTLSILDAIFRHRYPW